MAQLRLTTTGTLSPVFIGDLGNAKFTHPLTNFILYDTTLTDNEFTPIEISESTDLQDAVTAGYIILTDEYGNVITNVAIGVHNQQDEHVKISSNDTVTGYLSLKLVAGTNITLIELNDGSNETLQVNAIIANNYITNAMLNDVTTATFKGRITSGTGDPEDLTVAQAKTLLNLTGINSGDQTITLTGDVTGSGTTSFASTISNDAVTYAKIQNTSAASVLIGRGSAAGSGDVQEITIGSGLTLTGTILSSSGGTVTSVSVVTANGVSGTVATSTTTPAITLTLGAITPSSVASTGTLTGTNLSGTNTGDQTITLTSEVTGTGTGSFATTVNKILISNKTAVTPELTDYVLLGDTSDSDNLKKCTVAQLTSGNNWFTTTVTPTAISAIQHNYTATGLAPKAVLRINTNGANQDFSGFSNIGFGDRDYFLLINISSNIIRLLANDANSSVNNRILLNGTLSISKDHSCILYRDGITNKWRVMEYNNT